MKLNRNLKYRAYPTSDQQVMLLGWMGTLRWLWNRFNEQWKMVLGRPRADRIRPNFQWPSAIQQSKEMTELQNLPEFEWIQETQRHARQATLNDLEKAWKRCFQRLARAPRNKPRPNTPMRIYIPTSVIPFELTGIGKTRQLVLDRPAYRRLGPLKAIIDRPLQGKVKSWSIIKEGTEWYVIACCEIDRPDPKPVNDLSIGIDRGVVNLIADSEGTVIANPKLREKVEQRIKRLYRKASKQKRGSKNQRKTYDKANKLRLKAIRSMENLIDTETLRYAENYGTVVLEKLQLTNMTASAKGTIEKPGKNVKQKSGLNRAILNATPGKIAERLKYKVEERGGSFLEVPAAHTSDTCRMCGHSDPLNRIKQDEFRCVKCNHIEHADIHAAKNILARGLAGNIAVKQPRKKVSRPRRKPKSKNAEVKPTLKQPEPRDGNDRKVVEVSCCNGPVESGTMSCEAHHRDLLDRSVSLQRSETTNSEDSS